MNSRTLGLLRKIGENQSLLKLPAQTSQTFLKPIFASVGRNALDLVQNGYSDNGPYTPLGGAIGSSRDYYFRGGNSTYMTKPMSNVLLSGSENAARESLKRINPYNIEDDVRLKKKRLDQLNNIDNQMMEEKTFETRPWEKSPFE